MTIDKKQAGLRWTCNGDRVRHASQTKKHLIFTARGAITSAVLASKTPTGPLGPVLSLSLSLSAESEPHDQPRQRHTRTLEPWWMCVCVLVVLRTGVHSWCIFSVVTLARRVTLGVCGNNAVYVSPALTCTYCNGHCQWALQWVQYR